MFSQEALKIAKLGEPILRKKAKKVKNILNKDTQELIAKMLISVKKSGGVGLAAPQVFQSLRLLIIASKPNERYPHAVYREPFVMINPEVIKVGNKREKGWEGCLSIPGVRGKVKRYKKVKVRYTNIKDELIVEKLEGFIARVFQHEFDHLNGLVFLDNIKNTKDIISEEIYLKKKIKPHTK